MPIQQITMRPTVYTLADLRQVVERCEAATKGQRPEDVQVIGVGATIRHKSRLCQLTLVFVEPDREDAWEQQVQWNPET